MLSLIIYNNYHIHIKYKYCRDLCLENWNHYFKHILRSLIFSQIRVYVL